MWFLNNTVCLGGFLVILGQKKALSVICNTFNSAPCKTENSLPWFPLFILCQAFPLTSIINNTNLSKSALL